MIFGKLVTCVFDKASPPCSSGTCIPPDPMSNSCCQVLSSTFSRESFLAASFTSYKSQNKQIHSISQNIWNLGFLFPWNCDFWGICLQFWGKIYNIDGSNFWPHLFNTTWCWFGLYCCSNTLSSRFCQILVCYCRPLSMGLLSSL